MLQSSEYGILQVCIRPNKVLDSIRSTGMLACVQIQPDFLPAWQRIITRYSTGYAGGGVVYENGLVLPPYRDGTSLSPNLLCTLSFLSLWCTCINAVPQEASNACPMKWSRSCMPHRQVMQDRWAPSACALMVLYRPILRSQVEGIVCRFCGGLRDCAAAEQRHLLHVSAPRPGPYQRQQHSRGEHFDISVILCTLSAC